MPPNIYGTYGQAGVGREFLDSLLKSDEMKDIYKQGLLGTQIEGKKVVKKEVEEAQEQLKKEAKGPFDKLGFDPIALGLNFIPGFGQIASAAYSGIKAAKKSKDMSKFSQRLRKNLKEKFGESTGFLMDLYEGTGIDESLEEMKTSTLDDILAGAAPAALSYGTGEILGKVGDKIVKPGTTTGTTIGSTAGGVSKLKPTTTASKIGIKSPDFIKQGVGSSPISFEQAVKGKGMGIKAPDFIKKPDFIKQQVNPFQEKLMQDLAMKQMPSKFVPKSYDSMKATVDAPDYKSLGVKQHSPTFKTEVPRMKQGVAPGYLKQILDYYKPRNIGGRVKDFYSTSIKDNKELIQDLLIFAQGMQKK